MDIKTLKDYCISKKGAYEDFPFGPDVLVIKVQSKMFALISQRNNKVNVSLKCDPILAKDFRQQYESITPGYHLNKQHWNTIALDGTVPDSELLWMIDHSYELVVKNLSKSEKEFLEITA